MKITMTLNNTARTFDIEPRETLFHLLRRSGIKSVKFGSEDGADGYSIVLLNGKLCSSVVTLAAQADGATVLTVEGLSGHQHPGWNQKVDWHPLQRAFIETGAIQSGYDTPALILAGKALLDRNPRPTEAEVRDAISGIVSRETGYVKPVQAILRAAAYLRGEEAGLETGDPSGSSLGEALFRPPEGLFTLPDTPEPPDFGGG
ncbi:MAG: (2Fe-2S)-binding protein, partial [Anaerolineae bacterium]|nr:(2Fe-2S)-binding protein [Anaerolineae bacterium]